MLITDQPGRIFAIFLLVPSMIILALNLDKISKKSLKIIIIIFAIIFFIYELFWIIFYPSKKMLF